MATSKADEYRAKAREAEQLAERTKDSVIKEQALKIAEQWRYMAAFEEKLGDPSLGSPMTTLTLRRIKDHFVVTGPDIEPTRFKSRPEARDWCNANYPGSPVTEIGRDASSGF
jgi:hypothetical protein